jgi:hypothetical protein
MRRALDEAGRVKAGALLIPCIAGSVFNALLPAMR